MRFSPIALALSLSLAAVSSAGQSQKPDDQINPRSIALMKQGDEARRAGDPPRLIAASGKIYYEIVWYTK